MRIHARSSERSSASRIRRRIRVKGVRGGCVSCIFVKKALGDT